MQGVAKAERDTPMTENALQLLTNDHWVSRGYQQNFADAQKRIAILDIASCRIVTTDRPIKSNFRERGFTTYLDAGIPTTCSRRPSHRSKDQSFIRYGGFRRRTTALY